MLGKRCPRVPLRLRFVDPASHGLGRACTASTVSVQRRFLLALSAPPRFGWLRAVRCLREKQFVCARHRFTSVSDKMVLASYGNAYSVKIRPDYRNVIGMNFHVLRFFCIASVAMTFSQDPRPWGCWTNANFATRAIRPRLYRERPVRIRKRYDCWLPVAHRPPCIISHEPPIASARNSRNSHTSRSTRRLLIFASRIGLQRPQSRFIVLQAVG